MKEMEKRDGEKRRGEDEVEVDQLAVGALEGCKSLYYCLYYCTEYDDYD